MAKRRSNNKNTTIFVEWTDKDFMRRFADSGESDAKVFKKLLEAYAVNHTPKAEPVSTYSKSEASASS